MKKIRKNETAQSGGYYINNAIEGFWGENDEGGDMLEAMGLDRDRLPFSMAFYLKSRSVKWKDSDGKTVSLSFGVNDQKIEICGNYLGNRKVIVLYREWENYEDKDDIARLESEAIGYHSMRCIHDKMACFKSSNKG